MYLCTCSTSTMRSVLIINLSYNAQNILEHYCIIIPSPKRAHGRCTLHWARLRDGPIFEVSVSHLYVKERPGKLPKLAS